jgi:carbon monoxide dehydrogenase subunit G
MRMEFAGDPVIPAPRERVWEHLLDPHFVAASAPAVEAVRVIDPTRFSVVSGIGVGFLKLRFTLHIELHDLVEHESARMRASGEAPGTTVSFDSSVRLEPLGPERTRLHWDAQSEMHGAATGVGRRLLEGTLRKLTELFWQDFARRAAAEAVRRSRGHDARG